MTSELKTHTGSVQPMVPFAIGVLGLAALAVAFAVTKETGAVDSMLAKRGAAISIGLTMMWAANFLPKLLPPRVAPRSGPFGGVPPERFAGWTFVLAGALYVAVLAAAPIDYAMSVAALIGLAAFALTGANWGWAMLKAPAHVSSHVRHQASTSEHSDSHPFEASMRSAFLNLFFAFFWVFLTFLADAIWGDGVSQFMGVVFVFILVAGNAALLPYLRERRARA